MFLKDRSIKNIIAVGDYIGYFAKENGKQLKFMNREEFKNRFELMMNKNVEEISKEIGITDEQASILMPCIQVYSKLIK